MIRHVALASTALASALVFAAPAAAQDAQPTPPAPAGGQTEGVIRYPPEFFAASLAANAWEMLLRLPGFTLDTGDTIRGFEGGGGNALVDGQRPTSKTDPLDELLRRIPTGQIERVELIRGGAPGIDMQGRSVVANIVKKQGGGFQGLWAVALNHVYDGRDLHGVRLELSGGKDGRNWETSARYGFGADDGAGEGPGLIVSPTGAVLQQSEIDQEGTVANKTLTGAYETPLLGGKARVNARAFWEKFKFEEDNHILAPLGALDANDEVNKRLDTEIGGRFTRDFGAKTSLELVGLRQDKDIDLRGDFTGRSGSEIFTLNRQTSETIARGVLKLRPNPELSLEAGGEGAFNALDSLTGYVANGVPVTLPSANVRVEETRGQVFGKAVWQPVKAWTLEGVLRYEGSSISSEGDTSLEKTLYFAKPRFAATWAPTATTQVRFRFERVVGQLNFDDFVASSNLGTGVIVAGNPDLEPEQAWVTEAGIEQRFWTDGVISITLRHSAISDVIDRAPVFAADGGAFDAKANIGDATKDELILGLTIPFDRLGAKGLQLKGEATWRESEVRDPATGRDREISNLHPIDWEATLSHELPALKVNWGVDVYGAWRETAYKTSSIETRKLKTYVRPFAEWRARPDITIRAELPNITSRGFRYTRYDYAGPRGTSPLAQVEDRDIQFGRMYYVRVRKTFGV
ncbi:TonB-dependent receptor [Phenylobacterium sp. LH3H17]|uniref:TonB-dependent receptor plug domain-containing protein n=1 Tax=Phenylobacterium sp. LH3H17 TaxID=2903901 RepID=UPI0020CA0428|nr:TonB-dependent receptor [Phenylobacterium sp. LH3H17]UTP39069.1 TonB-dependent receptor [Phenylobacterium sp. LH3H17]